MLIKRLDELERAGVIERRPKPDGPGHLYQLTEAGADLSGSSTRSPPGVSAGSRLPPNDPIPVSRYGRGVRSSWTDRPCPTGGFWSRSISPTSVPVLGATGC